MARIQTNQMKITPAICYVPAIYGYSSHLIGWYRRYSTVNYRPSLVVSECLDNCARADCCFNHECPLYGFAVAQGIESKSEPIMLHNVPIILSRISQIIHLLFPKLFQFSIKAVYKKDTRFTKKNKTKKDIVTKQTKKQDKKGHFFPYHPERSFIVFYAV